MKNHKYENIKNWNKNLEVKNGKKEEEREMIMPSGCSATVA
jgi:hypothetical protein